MLRSTYRNMRIRARQQGGMRLEQDSLGPVQFHHVSFALSFDADATPLGALFFGQLTSASRWGFASPSRFAAVYRRAYGVPPNHTLHQG